MSEKFIAVITDRQNDSESKLSLFTCEYEKDGVKHQKLKVRASTIKFLPPTDRQGGFRQEGSTPTQFPSAPGQSPLETDPDDVPF